MHRVNLDQLQKRNSLFCRSCRHTFIFLYFISIREWIRTSWQWWSIRWKFTCNSTSYTDSCKSSQSISSSISRISWTNNNRDSTELSNSSCPTKKLHQEPLVWMPYSTLCPLLSYQRSKVQWGSALLGQQNGSAPPRFQSSPGKKEYNRI